MIYHTIQAPSDLVPNPDEITIFLAGSIEMGKAKPWHDAVASQIARRTTQPIAFYNPRRVEDFTPDMEDEQILWEQERLSTCDYIFMHLQGDTKSPISLLEFGEFIRSGKLFIDVPKDFYRYKNILLTAEQAGCAKRVSNDIDTNIARITDEISADAEQLRQLQRREKEQAKEDDSDDGGDDDYWQPIKEDGSFPEPDGESSDEVSPEEQGY